MDDKKRDDVVRMLADVKKEVDQKPARGKASASKKVLPRSNSIKKGGGARILYIEVDSNAGLAGALTSITKIKRDE